MGENTVNSFSFNKGQKMNIGNFDGVTQRELSRKIGNLNSSKAKLLASIFKKYDNGDGILTKAEYQALYNDLINIAKDGNLGASELAKFNSNLSTNGNKVDKNAYSMEDLQALIGMMTDGKDGVTTEGDKVVVTHEPTAGGIIIKDEFGEVNGKYVLQSQTRTNINDNSGGFVKEFYAEDGKTVIKSEFYENGKLSMVEEFDRNGNSTTTLYGEDGVTVNSRTRVSGSVTEDLDENGNVRRRVTDKGIAGIEIVEYASYGGEGTKTRLSTTPPPLDDLPAPPDTILKDKEITIPPDRAGADPTRLYKSPNGNQKYQYDEEGRVIAIYPADNGRRRTISPLVEFKYGSDGKLMYAVHNTYENGRWTGGLRYDGNGNLEEQWVNDQFDENHPDQFGRQITFDAQGKPKYVMISLGYDANGQETGYDTFKPDGTSWTWSSSRRNEYGSDGTFYTKYYYADNGSR